MNSIAFSKSQNFPPNVNWLLSTSNILFTSLKEAFSVEGLFLNPYHSVANILFWLMCRYNICIYRVSQEEGTKLRESVPYVKIYRYNPKHLYPKLNGYGDNGQRKMWSSGGSTHSTLEADIVTRVCPRLPCQITEIPLTLNSKLSPCW